MRRHVSKLVRPKRERVTRLELATSSLARRCSTTELHPHFTYEKRPNKQVENILVRLFYPAYAQAHMRTRQSVGGFQKEAENNRAQGAHHSPSQIRLAHRQTYSSYEN